MKKIFTMIVLFLLSTTTMFAQTQKQKKEDLKNFNPKYYLSVGTMVSTANTDNYKDFKYNSCPTIGAGMYFDNISVGVNLGRGNFADFDKDNIENYWYEANATLSANNKRFDPYILFGVGNYVNRNAAFVEYGIGTTVKFKRVNISVQTTNWDKVWYITPAITYNL
jgi:hypothetical protein